MKKVVLIVLLVLGGFAHQVAYAGFMSGSQSSKFRYLIQFGGPNETWEIVAGRYSYFMDQNGKPTEHFAGGGNSPWGDGSTMMDPIEGPLPHAMKIRWFSVLTNQFWEGEYQFDQARLQQLFTRKYRNLLYQTEEQGGKDTLFGFVINVLPTGLVTVWVTGGPEQYLLAQFQAHKTDMDWAEFISARGPLWKNYSREQWVAKMFSDNDEPSARLRQSRAKMQRNKGVFDISPWTQRMKKYPWQLVVSQPFTVKDYVSNYTNGERYHTYANAPVAEGTPRPMPHRINVYIESPDKKLSRFIIRLKEQEVMDTFAKLSGPSGQEKTVFLFELAEDFKQGRIYLQNQREKIKLTSDISLEKLYVKPVTFKKK